MSCFIGTFALLRWSGTEPIISPRSACIYLTAVQGGLGSEVFVCLMCVYVCVCFHLSPSFYNKLLCYFTNSVEWPPYLVLGHFLKEM